MKLNQNQLDKNLYQILGVDKSADDSTIKKAYRKLVVKHHPDKGGNADTFSAISEAYDILSDNRKVDYDTQSPHGKSYQPNPFGGGFGGGGGGQHFEDMLNRMRNGFGHPGNNGRENFNEALDLNINIGEVELFDLYNNPSKTYKYNRNVLCSYCDARGTVESEESVECLACNSTGKVYGQDCKQCSGSGRIHSKKCGSCNGDKVRLKDETITIKRYDPNSSTLVYKGMGHHSKFHRGLKGNLVIHTKLKSDKEYEVNGYDLIKKVPLDIKTAVFGGSVVFTHLQKQEDGSRKSIKFDIPPNTESNTKFRLRNLGLSSDKSGNVRGNLWVVLELSIDFSKLTDSDKKHISKLELNR
jgi:molecular chaperone DnaJ